MNIWEGEGSQAGAGECVNLGAFGSQRTRRDVGHLGLLSVQSQGVWFNLGLQHSGHHILLAFPWGHVPCGGSGLPSHWSALRLMALPETLSTAQGRPCAD